jgi:hypothetical protein
VGDGTESGYYQLPLPQKQQKGQQQEQQQELGGHQSQILATMNKLYPTI